MIFLLSLSTAMASGDESASPASSSTGQHQASPSLPRLGSQSPDHNGGLFDAESEDSEGDEADRRALAQADVVQRLHDACLRQKMEEAIRHQQYGMAKEYRRAVWRAGLRSLKTSQLNEALGIRIAQLKGQLKDVHSKTGEDTRVLQEAIRTGNLLDAPTRLLPAEVFQSVRGLQERNSELEAELKKQGEGSKQEREKIITRTKAILQQLRQVMQGEQVEEPAHETVRSLMHYCAETNIALQSRDEQITDSRQENRRLEAALIAAEAQHEENLTRKDQQQQDQIRKLREELEENKRTEVRQIKEHYTRLAQDQEGIAAQCAQRERSQRAQCESLTESVTQLERQLLQQRDEHTQNLRDQEEKYSLQLRERQDEFAQAAQQQRSEFETAEERHEHEMEELRTTLAAEYQAKEERLQQLFQENEKKREARYQRKCADKDAARDEFLRKTQELEAKYKQFQGTQVDLKAASNAADGNG